MNTSLNTWIPCNCTTTAITCTTTAIYTLSLSLAHELHENNDIVMYSKEYISLGCNIITTAILTGNKTNNL